MSQFVKWFNEVGLACLREVGGKGAPRYMPQAVYEGYMAANAIE